MARLTFGVSFAPELREILTSTPTAIYYDTNGREAQTKEQTFTEPWRLRWMGYDSELGRSRVRLIVPDVAA